MKSARISSLQFTVLKRASQAGIPFKDGVLLNQITFYNLLQQGHLKLDDATEKFYTTESGRRIYDEYTQKQIIDMQVKNNPPVREARVVAKVGGPRPPTGKTRIKPRRITKALLKSSLKKRARGAAA